MKIIENAPATFKKSASLHLIAFAAFLEAIIQCWNIIESYVPAEAIGAVLVLVPESIRDLARWVPLSLMVGAYGARFVAQKGLSLPQDETKEEEAPLYV